MSCPIPWGEAPVIDCSIYPHKRALSNQNFCMYPLERHQLGLFCFDCLNVLSVAIGRIYSPYILPQNNNNILDSILLPKEDVLFRGRFFFASGIRTYIATLVVERVETQLYVINFAGIDQSSSTSSSTFRPWQRASSWGINDSKCSFNIQL